MSALATSPAVAVCSHCKRERKARPDKLDGVKLPLGWKREAGAAVCRDCWQKSYVLRALTFGVASPITGTWKELEQTLRPLWASSTEAANWMMTQFYVRDVRREDHEKLPPMPRVYLYPEARRLFPLLAASTVASLEQTVGRKYRARRYDLIWTHRVSLPSMRYPQPYPIPNQAWKFIFNEQGQPVVDMRLGESRWEIRLKSGARYRRQTEGLRRMAEKGELAILKAHDGTLLIKLVGWLRRPAVKAKSNPDAALIVRTSSDHLLQALDTKEERLWIENCDQVRRWSHEHRKQLQRWSEDQKAEQRPQPSFAERRRRAVEKHHRRMASAIQEVAAHVGNFASRRGYSRVIYSDRERWVEDFPYAALEARLKTVLDERQIAFEKEEASEKFDEPPSGSGAASAP